MTYTIESHPWEIIGVGNGREIQKHQWERRRVLCVDWRLAVGTEMGKWKSTHAKTSNS